MPSVNKPESSSSAAAKDTIEPDSRHLESARAMDGGVDQQLEGVPAHVAQNAAAPASDELLRDRADEHGGQKGPEPTRYGDWEKKGRCTDF